MKYRKKPVVIDAVQITDEWFDKSHPDPLHPIGVMLYPKDRQAEVVTLEGKMRGNVGDWMITGVKGEKYFCKPDIFAQTYEPVEESRI